ncbi:hypothetical protein [Listeria sp. PSOL-1]|uniref:hypothetical protein n=1 Tax=Listeria sp. PSOL-1 TaxID=1844999 RepID=UPI0013D749D2|nr:hypothetical protein [Listeria sp. PSOL-1]
MSLKQKLEAEVHTFAAQSGLEITTTDLLYAGPNMRGRHSLILCFTNIGLFTFSFHLAEAVMYFLPKEELHKVELQKKTLVYLLQITTINQAGQVEQGKYFVSKRVLGRSWHRATLIKMIDKHNQSWFD